jgi:hypothetical protein
MTRSLGARTNLRKGQYDVHSNSAGRMPAQHHLMPLRIDVSEKSGLVERRKRVRVVPDRFRSQRLNGDQGMRGMRLTY